MNIYSLFLSNTVMRHGDEKYYYMSGNFLKYNDLRGVRNRFYAILEYK